MYNLKLYSKVTLGCSKLTTRSYSTSFSLGINLLDKKYHDAIYAIYGFVRFADEIVDTFHDHDKNYLLDKFEADTYEATEQGISLNPILHSFQLVVRQFNIDKELIVTFLRSMRMDLEQTEYSRQGFEDYILGSAEVVGLMCLKVFVNGNDDAYNRLKPSAMRLGAAFQKVNFLRDLKADFEDLGRAYFPGVDMSTFNHSDKLRIEAEIEEDFRIALEGIKQLPSGARRGVYVAYVYYKKLFDKIKSTSAERLMTKRIRIHNGRKMTLMLDSLVRLSLNAY
jgi:phytoene/squalene synthetase